MLIIIITIIIMIINIIIMYKKDTPKKYFKASVSCGSVLQFLVDPCQRMIYMGFSNLECTLIT